MIKSRKRLFIGIPLKNTLDHVLPNIKSLFMNDSKNIKWINPKNMHITLSFLGNLMDDKIPILKNILADILIQNNFYVNIETTGVFPNIKSANVFWMGLRNGKEKIIELQLIMEKALHEFIDDHVKEIYTPHITIARKKKPHVKIDVLPFLKYVYSPIELNVNTVALYESCLHQSAVKYKALTKFQLN